MMIRKAVVEDLPRLVEIIEIAKKFMAETGNPTQWRTGGPTREVMENDIREKRLYVIENETGVHAVFMFAIMEDPTYAVITEGDWGSNETYGVIHRVAGDGAIHGILQEAVRFAGARISHLRIDTHHDNKVMQKAIQKCGFEERGIIFLEDGSPRIAYERIG